VLLNLIADAIDSMVALDERRLLCVNSDVHDDGVTTSRMTLSFSLSCAPTMRHLLILREVRKPTISRQIRASDADS
jgi:hypothetical protein